MYQGVLDEDVQPRERLIDRVGDRIDVHVGVDGDEAATIERCTEVDADVVFVTSRVPLSRPVLEATDLEVVAKLGTGIDNVDLEAARELGIAVTHTPGVNALSVAEHSLGLLLAVRRHTVAGQRKLAAGGWRDTLPTGSLLSETTVGVVGFGDVGRRTASLLRGFDVETLWYDPYVDDVEGEVVHAEATDFAELLARSDSVVVNAELTPETRGLIDGDALARMRDDAVLVNTARGPLVDHDALVAALDAGELGGVGLDVHAEEPLPPDSPIHDFDNATLTPHVGGATWTARRNGVDALTTNVLRLLDGDPVSERYLAVDGR